jgi:hypothetical protein
VFNPWLNFRFSLSGGVVELLRMLPHSW